jgi:SAM-dependent methyltransferase
MADLRHDAAPRLHERGPIRNALVALARALPGARTPRFNHNDHYHARLLALVPDRAERVLDVGCGTGAFVRNLASRATFVEGIDRSPDMVSAAIAGSVDHPNVTFREADLLTADLDEGAYDFVSSIASLHHMPVEPALQRLARLLRPGGTLAVLGLPRIDTPTDFAYAALAYPVNAIVESVLAARRAPSGHSPAMPLHDPELTVDDMRAIASSVLPGSTVGRLLFWRYLLVWKAPA